MLCLDDNVINAIGRWVNCGVQTEEYSTGIDCEKGRCNSERAREKE